MPNHDAHASGAGGPAGDYRSSLLDARGDEHYLLVLITADKDCAAHFNTT